MRRQETVRAPQRNNNYRKTEQSSDRTTDKQRRPRRFETH